MLSEGITGKFVPVMVPNAMGKKVFLDWLHSVHYTAPYILYWEMMGVHPSYVNVIVRINLYLHHNGFSYCVCV